MEPGTPIRVVSAVSLVSLSTAPRAVMVTGGCGFIGSNFVNYIAARWPKTVIVNYDKLMPGADAFNVDEDVRRQTSRYHLVVGDIENERLVYNTFQQYNIDTVVNFAANSHVDDCYEHPIGTTKNNVLGTTHFLEACKRYGRLSRFVHISSDEVYGDSGLSDSEVPKPEHTLLTPTNTYSATKASCEAMIHAYATSFHLPVVTLRMNNVYGPRQWSTKVVPHFIERAVAGESYTLMGDGMQLRSWMFTEDCVRGISMVTERGTIGEIYNLGTHFELNIRQLAEHIHNEVARQRGAEAAPFKLELIPDRPYNDRRYFIDTNKMHNELGWYREVSFEEGLSRTIAWYLRAHKPSSTMRVLVFGGRGWIGGQFCRLLEAEGVDFLLANTRPGGQADALVEQEILEAAPSHIACFIGRTHGAGTNSIEYLEGGPDKLKENTQDNLYAPWLLATLCDKLGVHMTYAGTGCIFQYDDAHRIGGAGYTEADEPNYFGNSYSVTKGFTDRIMRHFTDALNVRIRLPVNFEHDKRNLVAKVVGFKRIYDVPNSITILPDALPLLLRMMRDRRTGTFNLTNPGAVRHSETLAAYAQLTGRRDDAQNNNGAAPPTPQWEVIGEDDAMAERMAQSRANCTLDTSKIQGVSPKALRPACEGVSEALQRLYGLKQHEHAELPTSAQNGVQC